MIGSGFSELFAKTTNPTDRHRARPTHVRASEQHKTFEPHDHGPATNALLDDGLGGLIREISIFDYATE